MSSCYNWRQSETWNNVPVQRPAILATATEYLLTADSFSVNCNSASDIFLVTPTNIWWDKESYNRKVVRTHLSNFHIFALHTWDKRWRLGWVSPTYGLPLVTRASLRNLDLAFYLMSVLKLTCIHCEVPPLVAVKTSSWEDRSSSLATNLPLAFSHSDRSAAIFSSLLERLHWISITWLNSIPF